jgi:hypothetical protein
VTAGSEGRRSFPIREGHRYWLLLVSILASFAVLGAVPPTDAQQIVVSVLLGTSVLLALWTAGVSRRLIALGALVASVVIALTVVRAISGGIGEGTSRAMNALLVSLGPPAVGLGVVRTLRTRGEVTLEAVTGVLCFYILLGMVFAFVFGTVDKWGGDPFFAQDVPATVSRCLYFSFTTLSTVGYGDLTARSDLGHTLSVSEALLGQVYLVTVVSVIVSNLRRRPRQAEIPRT